MDIVAVCECLISVNDILINDIVLRDGLDIDVVDVMTDIIKKWIEFNKEIAFVKVS